MNTAAVKRAERILSLAGVCPDCQGMVVLVGEGEPEPEPCPRCGRRPCVVRVIEELVAARGEVTL